MAQDDESTFSGTPGLKDDSYKELTLREWNKFKNFEQKLLVSQHKESNGQRQLRNYARDSIKILGVKLMAVKLLNIKNLLDRDIAENGTYYASLLKELRKSAIPETEYLFLEEKMAYLNQSTLQSELSFSRWLNLGLIVLCILLGAMVYVYQIRNKVSMPSTLSRQEITVRNLILEGKTNKEIANELFISLSTVKTHITNLYAKLNVTNRRELFQKGTGTST